MPSQKSQNEEGEPALNDSAQDSCSCEPNTFCLHTDSGRTVYSAVAERRTSFDTLLWQVPVLAFTAQAFLFPILLSGKEQDGRSKFAALFIIAISAFCVYLVTKQREAEETDAGILADMEKATGYTEPVHGISWAKRRNKKNNATNEGGATTNEGGATTNEGGATTNEDGATTNEDGATTEEAATWRDKIGAFFWVRVMLIVTGASAFAWEFVPVFQAFLRWLDCL